MSSEIQEMIARVAGDVVKAGSAVAFGGVLACYVVALFYRILRKAIK